MIRHKEAELTRLEAVFVHSLVIIGLHGRPWVRNLCCCFLWWCRRFWHWNAWRSLHWFCTTQGLAATLTLRPLTHEPPSRQLMCRLSRHDGLCVTGFTDPQSAAEFGWFFSAISYFLNQPAKYCAQNPGPYLINIKMISSLHSVLWHCWCNAFNRKGILLWQFPNNHS